MIYICCGSQLSLPYASLTYGSAIDMTEVEGEELALAGKPLVPASLVKLEFDGSEGAVHELHNTYLEYRKSLQESFEEKEK